MTDLPNIIFIITDQQRSDSINALGSPWMQTPHLDRLAAEGMAFANCFVTSPVCVASRASLFQGMYPHATGVFTNFEPWEPTWVRWLADAGYHCVNIGKMHINPYDSKGGFHQRFMVENKDRPLFLDEHPRAIYDEWDKALHARGLAKPSRYTRAQSDPERFLNALGCFEWELDPDMHPDSFIGDTAAWWIEERQSRAPLFLQIGFPGPHPPYDPTREFLELYQDVDIPVPHVSEEELASQPAMHARLRRAMEDFNIDSVAWRDRPDAAALLNLRRHYAANVSMIDDKIGRIMSALHSKGYLDNAIVIFCSDHADALGDHGHIQKWTMYDSVVRVPLIIWGPDRVRANSRCDELVQLMDLAPTILEAAGVEAPRNWSAKSLTPLLSSGRSPDGPFREHVYSELGRDHIQSASEFVIMRRDHRWKFVIYPGEEGGELYDLESDPDELVNLWDCPDHLERRQSGYREILAWAVLDNFRSGRSESLKPQAPMSVAAGHPGAPA